MRGAPQVGFSATIRKIHSRISLQVCLRPSGFLTLEISLQSKRKPTRCHRTTVSGVTMMRDSFHPDQNRRTATQKDPIEEVELGSWMPALQYGELLA